jgi:nucleoside-diphosphate-sugar epimerase
VRTVLITGASGFIGRHLCLSLSRQGLRVIAGTRAATLPAELEGHVELRRMPELGSPQATDADLQDIDAIVHLAARVHVMRDTAEDPLSQYRRVNADATLRLARSAARHGVARFVFVSTVKVNGERTTLEPFSDHDEPAPVDPYAASKWEAERGLAGIASETGLRVITLRPPLVYGSGVKGNFLRLLRLARMRLPLPLASIENSRSMIYVGNLASAIGKALAVDANAGGTYLVSDDADVSTPQLVKMLGAAMGRPARLFAVPPGLLLTLGRALGKGDEMMRMIESLRVDCSGIKQQFQWAPPFTLEQGIKETAEWYVRTSSA